MVHPCAVAGNPVIAETGRARGFDALWTARWQVWVGIPVIVLATVVVVASSNRSWHWAYFVWAVVVGSVAVILLVWLTLWMATKRWPRGERRAPVVKRLVFSAVPSCVVAVCVGIWSAALSLAWVDVVLTAFVVVWLACIGATLRRLRRVMRRNATTRPT